MFPQLCFRVYVTPLCHIICFRLTFCIFVHSNRLCVVRNNGLANPTDNFKPKLHGVTIWPLSSFKSLAIIYAHVGTRVY